MTVAQIEQLNKAPEFVKKLADGAEYIPIGHIEKTLDQLDPDWGTTDFKFQIIKVTNYWFADASCTLWINQIPMQGAVTYQISSKDDNMDFSATALSFCIANAAKRRGIVFGRALNGRLDAGETAIPIISSKEPFLPDEKSDAEWNEIKEKLKKIKWKEDAQEYINTTGYHMTVEAKSIINSKKSKEDGKK